MWNSRIKDENWNKFAESNKIDDGKKSVSTEFFMHLPTTITTTTNVEATVAPPAAAKKQPLRVRIKKNTLGWKCLLFIWFSSLSNQIV